MKQAETNKEVISINRNEGDAMAKKLDENSEGEENNRYQRALEAVYTELYEYNYANDVYQLLYSAKPATFLFGHTGKLSTLLEFRAEQILPEDREYFGKYCKKENLFAILERRSSATGIFRLQNQTGKCCFLEETFLYLNQAESRILCCRRPFFPEELLDALLEEKTKLIVQEKSQRLQLLEEQMEQLLSGIPGAAVILEGGNELRVLYANGDAAKLFGYETGEFLKKMSNEFLTMVHPEDVAELKKHFQNSLLGEDEPEASFRFRNKAEEYQWVNLKGKRLKDGRSHQVYYGVFYDIDRLKKSEIAERLQREMFEIAMSHSNLRFWEYNIRTKELYRSKTVQDTAGYGEYVQNVPESFVEEGVIHPDYAGAYLKFYETIRTGKDAQLTFKAKREDGIYDWMDISYKVLFDDENRPVRAIGVGSNLSQQREKEAQYLEAYKELQEICNFIVEKQYKDVILVDTVKDIGYLFYAQGIAKGKQKIEQFEEQLKKRFLQILPDGEPFKPQQDFMKNLLERIEQNGGSESFAYHYQRADGSTIWMELTAVFFQPEKRNLLMIFKDIDQEIRKEKEAKEKLEKALSIAERASAAKQNFLSHMSHEIRTPLNGIKGSLDLLKEQPGFSENGLLNQALLSTKHLISLVNDILDMSKIESGKLQLSKQAASWNEIFHQVYAIIAPLAKAKNITLNCQVAPADFQAIYIDRNRLLQILINVLSNSVKYTNEGGSIHFEVQIQRQSKNRANLTFLIEDNGIGMSREFLQKVYEPFEQERINYGNYGSGLGLTITKQILELMGGTIQIESKEQAGTTVIISFETEIVLEKEIVSENLIKNSEKIKNITQFFGKRAFVVEDNEINRNIGKLQLEAMGLFVETANDGEEAVQIFKASKEAYYDIIFMDIMMPKKDGLEAAREIRSLSRADAQTIPIVAMTANAFAEDIHKSLENGMNYHLSKPFERAELIRILQQEFFENFCC